MRVGFDARWYNDSGVGTYVAQLLSALVRAGCELVVYADPENRVPGLESLNVAVVPVASGKYSPLGQLELRHRVQRDRLDLFHSPFYPVPRIGCPVVVTIHDLIPFHFKIYPRLKQELVKAGYRAAVSRAAHIIAVSEMTANEVVSVLGAAPEKITAIHHAASPANFYAEGDAQELEILRKKFGMKAPYVVVSSAKNWHTKNLKGALQVLEAVRARVRVNFQTILYGPPDGVMAAGGAERWRDLDVQQVGLVSTDELGMIFRHANAFLMPSLFEGFGLPVVEAMACGCPVIASNRGALPEVTGRGAQCFDPFDVAGMAEAVACLLCSPVELEQWKRSALFRARDFSWDKAAQKTVSVYHHVNRKFQQKNAKYA